MEFSKRIIDAKELIGDENTALILRYTTGVFYTAQVGGLGCVQKRVEGFCLNLGNFMQDFDDCSYGCAWIQDEKNRKQRLNLFFDLDLELAKQCRGKTFYMTMNYDRIDELEEGWWPIDFFGSLDSFKNHQNHLYKGYLHIGNCD